MERRVVRKLHGRRMVRLNLWLFIKTVKLLKGFRKISAIELRLPALLKGKIDQ
jgi:hypothetical protein